MTKADFAILRERIEEIYQKNLAALECLRSLVEGGPNAPRSQPASKSKVSQSESAEKKRARRSANMRDWYAKRRAGKQGRKTEVKALAAADFRKFLVKGPKDVSGNGD